jgi:ABC-type lipoprotein export system ATPase subunit
MHDSLVKATGLSRMFETDGVVITALRPADFEIPRGAHIALCGPSGSGKTTLLHLISGIDQPTSGRIEWPSVGGTNAIRPVHVGLAFQGPSLLPALSVVENIELPLLLIGHMAPDKARQEAVGLIERMELNELTDKLPEELSGGQSQRVALARALVTRPSLLLADEPTGQQDQTNAKHLMDFIFAFAAEHGTAIIAATHDRFVVRRFPTQWRIDDGLLSTTGGATC